jgi:hypothetical protein
MKDKSRLNKRNADFCIQRFETPCVQMRGCVRAEPHGKAGSIACCSGWGEGETWVGRALQ